MRDNYVINVTKFVFIYSVLCDPSHERNTHLPKVITIYIFLTWINVMVSTYLPKVMII